MCFRVKVCSNLCQFYYAYLFSFKYMYYFACWYYFNYYYLLNLAIPNVIYSPFLAICYQRKIIIGNKLYQGHSIVDDIPIAIQRCS